MARPPAPMPPEALARLHLAAAQEFGALGLDRASLNRILANSGTAKSTFYHRYESKRALYDELIGRVEDAVASALARLDAEPRSRAEFWRGVLDALAELDRAVAEHPELKAVAGLIYRPDATAELGRLRRGLADRIRARLVQGQSLGAVRTDLPVDLLAEMAVAMLLAVDAWALEHAEDEHAAASVSRALDSIRATIGGG
ncbi:TetR/AcrR family transcriptional regulator [Gulosibacter sp. 10]|uniref:TetR/AcrR family transcriptional regulator n=1 Tax=Gulosibacter sp. 10 TaxID=1255570 RepID=UPI00097EE2DC|nr:TetR family transcriptional regulator [Gulosibacter sp. 10]SJM58093.1 Transcriptional regulator, TetR family [Gulosibacter sp. 10]